MITHSRTYMCVYIFDSINIFVSIVHVNNIIDLHWLKKLKAPALIHISYFGIHTHKGKIIILLLKFKYND